MTAADFHEAAVHEAGHTVIGHALDVARPHTVTAWDGRDAATSRYVDDLNLDDRGLEALIAESFGGVAALEAVGSRDPSRGADGDVRHARELATLLDARRVDALVDRGFAVARNLSRTHRSAIEQFAGALEGNGGRLAGSEVARALEWAFAGHAWTHEADFDHSSRRRDLFEARVRAGMTEADLAALWTASSRDALQAMHPPKRLVVSGTDAYRAALATSIAVRGPSGWRNAARRMEVR